MIELGYGDGELPRMRLLRTIGRVEILYDHHRPSAIGDRQLDYEPSGGRRLVRIGDRDIRYRIWMGTVKQLGGWQVRYGPVVPLLRRIGPFPVERRGPWFRPSRVGPATLGYEPGERDPRTVVVPPPADLSDDLVLAVAFSLLEHLWRPTGG